MQMNQLTLRPRQLPTTVTTAHHTATSQLMLMSQPTLSLPPTPYYGGDTTVEPYVEPTDAPYGAPFVWPTPTYEDPYAEPTDASAPYEGAGGDDAPSDFAPTEREDMSV